MSAGFVWRTLGVLGALAVAAGLATGVVVGDGGSYVLLALPVAVVAAGAFRMTDPGVVVGVLLAGLGVAFLLVAPGVHRPPVGPLACDTDLYMSRPPCAPTTAERAAIRVVRAGGLAVIVAGLWSTIAPFGSTTE